MLLTKLHIPNPGNKLVHRSVLMEKLNHGFHRKLILVSASAGFGKTTTITDWITKEKIPAAWYSIDANDNDTSIFLSYLITSIQSIKKDFGENALKLLQSPTIPNPESIINLLINEIINIEENFILVLDDFHQINNQEIVKSVSYFLEYMPENIHFAILSRSDTSLPIAKLRSQNQLLELRTSDLSFSANDIATLFNKMLNAKLKIEDIQSLKNKTEGWIAGLQLTAMSLQGHEDASVFVNELAGNNRYIMDYLMEEVFKSQTDEISDFLIKTSLFEQFSASLCNAVLGINHSQLIIEKMENNNMFVFPLDSERKWYRYHHLFADLLKQRLLLMNSQSITDLHKKACSWFEENDMHNLAINHALEIKDYKKGVQLIGQVIESMWENGQHAAILKYSNIITDDLIKSNPEYCLYYGWILISTGQTKKAEPLLKSAEKATIEVIQSENINDDKLKYYKKLLGKISIAFAYMNSHQEFSDKVFDYCQTAMENISKDDPFWYSWAWFSYGVSYFSNGELEKGSNAYHNAFEYAKLSGNIYLISTIVIRMAENEQQLGHYKSAYKKCKDLLSLLKDKGYSQITKTDWTFASLYFIMGVSEYIWTDSEKAIENLNLAYELSQSSNDVYQKVFILLACTGILNDCGYIDESKSKMSELETLIHNYDLPPFITGFYIGAKIHLFTQNNQVEEARLFFNEHGKNFTKEITNSNEPALSAYARLMIAENNIEEAEKLIIKLLEMVSKNNNVERMLDHKIMLAIINNTKDKRTEAINILLEAMELASKDNLLSYFVFNYHNNIELYKDVFKTHATKKTNVPQKFIDDLKVAIEKKIKANKTVDTDLSSRELDTLKLIAKELTNQEIADKLFISLNTVKTHLRNIYLKLEVENRTKAVTKAKELNLL